MKIKIKGISKADILLALYNHARYAGPAYQNEPEFRVLARDTPVADPCYAEELLKNAIETQSWVFENVNLGYGERPLHVDLTENNYFDPIKYDYQHGYPGYAEQIIADRRRQYRQLPGLPPEQPSDDFTYLASRVGTLFLGNRTSRNGSKDQDHSKTNGLGF